MVYAPPLYPTAIPSVTDLPDRYDDIDWLLAARYNELKKELLAVENELGTVPKGSASDLKTRLAVSLQSSGALRTDLSPAFQGMTFYDASWTGGRVTVIPAGLTAAQINVYINASSVGDLLLLASTSYSLTAAVVVNKAITLAGCGAYSTTLVQATNDAPVIQITDNNAVVQDLTCINNATGGSGTYGIYIIKTGGSSGHRIRNVNISIPASGASSLTAGIRCWDASADFENVIINAVSSAGQCAGIQAYDNTASLTTINNIRGCYITATRSGGTGWGLYLRNNSGTLKTVNIYNTYSYGNTNGVAGAASTTTVNGFNSIFNGGTNDVSFSAGTITLINCVQVNNTPSGTFTYRSWTAWTPTLTWTTGTPASVTTVARFTLCDGYVKFKLYITSADSNAATALTVTLPITPKDINAHTAVAAQCLSNATYSDPLGYIDQLDNTAGNRLLKFNAFPATVDGTVITFEVSGEYEI